MLQWINDRMKLIGWIFILPLALVFAVWGVHGIVDFTTRSDRGLRVNGEEINVERVRQAYQERLAALSRQYPDEVPAAVRTRTQQAVVDQFVEATLLDQRVKAQRFVVSDRDVIEAVQAYQGFQVAGKFNKDAYYGLLRAQGYTPERFEAEQRQQLRLRALEGGIALSSFVTPKELATAAALRGETREVAYAIVPVSRFVAAASVDEAAVKAYYDAHKDAFRTPETVRLAYVALRVADAAKDVAADEGALKAYYETVKDRFVEAEKRHARHILIPVGTDPVAAERKAEEVYAAAVKPGADFAALARQYSQDTGSAQQGGDLGWAEKSFFVGPFADAVFAMQAGETSRPVKTQFGWHVIRLEGIQPGQSKRFDEVRAELEPEFKKTEAERRFGEKQEKIEQLAFEQSGSLEPVAKALGLKIEEIAGFQKGLAGNELAANPKVLLAAFSADVLGGQNSKAIELSPGNVVVLRASDHKLPEQLPLEAVRARVEDAVRREVAARDAAAAADRLAAALKGGAKWEVAVKALAAPLAAKGKPPAADAPKVEGPRYVLRTEPGVPPEVLRAAFAAGAPVAGHAAIEHVALASGDVAVLTLSAVKPGELKGDGALERRQLAAATAASEFAVYVARARAGAEVKYNPAVFD